MINSIFTKNSFYSLITPFDDRCLEAVERAIVAEDQDVRGIPNSLVETTRFDTPELIPSLGLQVLLLKEQLQRTFGDSMKESWMTKYNRGGFQELQCRPEFELMAILFLEDRRENDGRFYFYDKNRRFGVWSAMMEQSEFHYVDNNKKGDVLFFPSYMMYGITPHQGRKPLKTVTFGYEVCGVDLFKGSHAEELYLEIKDKLK